MTILGPRGKSCWPNLSSFEEDKDLEIYNPIKGTVLLPQQNKQLCLSKNYYLFSE